MTIGPHPRGGAFHDGFDQTHFLAAQFTNARDQDDAVLDGNAEEGDESHQGGHGNVQPGQGQGKQAADGGKGNCQ